MTQQYATISPLSITTITTSLLLLIITFKSHELIGFIYGPSSQLFATKQQIIQSNLLSRILSYNHHETISSSTTALSMKTWMTRIAAKAEQIYNPHYELAYENDCNTCILRDGGVIAALYVLLHACNFFGTTASTTKQQQQQSQSSQRRRLYYLYLAGVLFILPGMIGQLVFSKTIPIEIVLLNHLRFFNNDNSMNVVSLLSGMLERLLYVGYCSLKSVVLDYHHYGGGGGDLVVGSVVVYELKVVGVALVFVASFLG